MKERKDRPKDAPPASDAKSPAVGGEKRSGRAGFDERGNSVWEWQLETGVYSRDVSTQKLKKLELGELSIADTAVSKRPEGLGATEPAKPQKRGGFNPYDSSAPSEGGFNPYDNAHSLGRKLQPQPLGAPPPAPRRKPADLQKLGDWLKLKRQAQEAKDREDDAD
jgi:hypothetical protein